VANARGGGWIKDKCSNFCGGNESNDDSAGALI